MQIIPRVKNCDWPIISVHMRWELHRFFGKCHFFFIDWYASARGDWSREFVLLAQDSLIPVCTECKTHEFGRESNIHSTSPQLVKVNVVKK